MVYVNFNPKIDVTQTQNDYSNNVELRGGNDFNPPLRKDKSKLSNELGVGKLSKFFKILLLMFVISGLSNKVFASDNVLQAIQVNGVKDSYNIILKSDDIAELKKTIQAPNKMVLNLKGIRASKTINTIYNNTSSVDSVVVEPTGEDSVKILIQADNVGNAGVHFDTLKTPLGVLGKSEKQNEPDELILNEPISSYKPVYDDSMDEEDTGFSLAGTSGSAVKRIKKILKNEKISWMVTFGLFSILVLSGIKTIKGKDNEIKVGLAQSLKQREIDLYRGSKYIGADAAIASKLQGTTLNPAGITTQNLTGANYGLKAYQQGTKSPYLTPEIQRPRPAVAPPAPSVNLQQVNNTNLKTTMQNTIQKTAPVSTRPKTANIDSMKFLESMTKIYEKNGRSDLAQGLKTNMKKAKVNLA